MVLKGKNTGFLTNPHRFISPETHTRPDPERSGVHQAQPVPFFHDKGLSTVMLFGP